ncbi:MAG: tagatose-bisphosphate aldolase [Candidatus Zambryskibacteria bacterium CG22_combo_CG10-13_8_21_14_all_42_17]|uniref:Tagatose-bisphosphate aldolase n=1 Tax=Candidatus Zambryskibacteria bacterium CG22_combo_CG10-13_8_21_14_all_42_17 TaxID=1975118 RepID=A0A2H0BE46_9BACT|nr:MAG: tagatose-bisphosphate aldolase [Candidatus Zambryskibacteria bacterium CG22_combo_CG10-13_8_21_14_all_42_17]
MDLITQIKKAEENNTAIGHFNISNMEMFWAVVDAVRELKLPAIIGLSEGEREFFGLRQIVLLVKDFRENEGLPIFTNADHTYSFELVKEAVDAGCDSVIFDGASLSNEENKSITKKCAEYAKEKSVLIEGELGYIGKSSKMLDGLPNGAEMTGVEESVDYVKETGVDLFAPAVGNIHGMLRGVQNPRLNIERIKDISSAVKVPLVLHGGSGLSNQDFVSAIKAGVRIIHISTEMRVAYRSSLDETLKNNLDELAPYRILKNSRDAVKDVVLARMRLFNS